MPAAPFVRTEAAGGVVLLGAAAVALAWANSPWHASYATLWHDDVVHRVVNEGLMAVFFLVVGLEVKREVVVGELRRWKTAALPVAAALGGMAVPALVYAAFNRGGPGSAGWGIPMATDIAFALGVLAVVGRRAHPSLKLFLLALAVADDIGAIVVIAVFYAGDLSVAWLLAAGAIVVVLGVLLRLGRLELPALAVLGAALWFAMFQSGVHATIAGVALGLLTPVALIERIEGALHPWSSFVVVPVFALANSGVRLAGVDLGVDGAGAVAVGTAVALVGGKFVGVLGASWLAVRARVGELPVGMRWVDVAGGAACAGIGFTVSLFVAGLAFDSPALTEAARVGIVAGSLAAALFAAAVLSIRRAEPG